MGKRNRVILLAVVAIALAVVAVPIACLSTERPDVPAKPQASAPASRPAGRLPELRYIVLETGDRDSRRWSFWKPDGTAVDEISPAMREELKNAWLSGARGLVADPKKLSFLYYSPDCDQSSFVDAVWRDSNGIALTGTNGQRIPDDTGTLCENGWITYVPAISAKDVPPVVSLSVTWGIGPWKDVATIALPLATRPPAGNEGIRVLRVCPGSDPADTEVVVALPADTRQWGVDLMLVSGERMEGSCDFMMSPPVRETTTFGFKVALKDIARVVVRSRPTRTVCVKDISLVAGQATHPRSSEIAPQPYSRPATRPAADRITREYDVRDLLQPVRDAVMPPVWERLTTSAPAWRKAPNHEEMAAGLLDLIRFANKPDSWPPDSIRESNGILTITHTPAMHAAIQELIRQLSEARWIPTLIDIKFIDGPLPEDMRKLLAKAPRTEGVYAVTAEEAEGLRANALVTSQPRMALFDGQTGVRFNGKQRELVLPGKGAAEQRVMTFAEGSALLVTSAVTPDRKAVAVTIRRRRTELISDGKEPVWSEASGSATATVPDGDWALVELKTPRVQLKATGIRAPVVGETGLQVTTASAGAAASEEVAYLLVGPQIILHRYGESLPFPESDKRPTTAAVPLSATAASTPSPPPATSAPMGR